VTDVVVGRRLWTAVVVCALAVAGCAGDGSTNPTDVPSAADDAAAVPDAPDVEGSGGDGPSDTADDPGEAQQFPDIVDASLIPRQDGTYDVEVTVSSPYDTPARYADGWRVLAPDGEVLGAHMLLHDHANEQPFTRTQRGLVIPDGIAQVTIEGRDLEFGYGGSTLVVDVPPSQVTMSAALGPVASSSSDAAHPGIARSANRTTSPAGDLSRTGQVQLPAT
jgi:hypothetical protein